MDAAAKPQVRRKVDEVLTEAVRARAAPARKQETAPLQAPESNPFYKIFISNADPEEKRQAMTKLLVGTKAETAPNFKALADYREWLASVRADMAQEIIRLNDNEVMAIVQDCITDLNNGLLNVEEKISPITDMLDAIYTLRTNKAIASTFAEIVQDRKNEAKFKADQDAKNQELAGIERQIQRLDTDMAVLGQQKGFFGSVKQSALTEIARKKIDKETLEKKLAQTETDLQTITTQASELAAKTGQYAKEKQKLRELIDLKRDDHQRRCEDVVKSSLEFCQYTKQRSGDVRVHLNQREDQIENTYNANNLMNTVYATINAAVEDAAKENNTIRDRLANPESPEESNLAKIQREQKKMDMDDVIGTLKDTALDALKTSTELTTQAIRIGAMRESNRSLISKVRTLNTEGVAGISDRISTTLQAVQSSALNEAAMAVKDTMLGMAERTDQIAEKEVIRVATGVDEVNDDLKRQLEKLGDYGAVAETATQIRRTGFKEVRENMEELRKLAAKTQEIIRDASSVYSEGTAIEKDKDKGEEEKTKPSLFRFGQEKRA